VLKVNDGVLKFLTAIGLSSNLCRWHYNFGREFGSRNAVVIDVGSWPKYGLTPGDGAIEDIDFFVSQLIPLCPNLVETPNEVQIDDMEPIMPRAEESEPAIREKQH
jgi:hypothetical protein